MQTERLESMSPNGFLRLFRQNDGDICLTIGQGQPEGGFESIASVEFCTPMAGGGGSLRTYRALIQLMAAMAADNLDDSQKGRRPPRVDNEDQRKLVEWGEQCSQAFAAHEKGE